ncbi:hypothetical protein COC42_14835 [Sphingomonas spermidinifaciens]|uniref:Uncharacterized protein n=1 Tax=Sphingomonas spermidinifaciens TaxID=1141889 RepID=A0A2A4B0E6_9SPHN|nr:hypothetical protein [Sphingomonas spermidinifaciens]PCD02663.1 hypothetical protein COC42_14835 [Sphingomonas spermidinifaciens]
MPAKTDPASEFAALCDKLAPAVDARGSDHLASMFNVEEWSLEFYQILFCIIERANLIKQLMETIPEAAHIAPDAIAHIDDLLQGFKPLAMQKVWGHVGAQHVNAKNIQPIKILSAFLRMHVSYPALSDAERADVIGLVDELLTWLEDIQIAENDFIRQALIDGLRQFSFRLERVEWLGWGYTVASLRDVIGAYLALERGLPNDGSAPQADAIVRKVGAGLKGIYERVGFAKDAVERADFILKAYGAASLYVHSHGGIAGLLTFG